MLYEKRPEGPEEPGPLAPSRRPRTSCATPNGLFDRLIPREAMDLQVAFSVDFTKDAEYGLLVRTSGIGMAGFSAGWFRLKGSDKVLVFLTDQTRAIAVPPTNRLAHPRFLRAEMLREPALRPNAHFSHPCLPSRKVRQDNGLPFPIVDD